MRTSILRSLTPAIIALYVAATAHADSSQFNGFGTNPANSNGLAASALFTVTNGNFSILLTNTSGSAALVPSDILTGVYFSIANNPTLSQVSVTLPSSSDIVVGSAVQSRPANNVVGGEFAYRGNLNGDAVAGNSFNGANYGVSNSGLGLFGNMQTFPGGALPNGGGTPPDGLGYGITTASFSASANTPVTTRPLIKNAVLIQFSLANTFDINNISNVTFQYGTSLSEPRLTGILVVPTGVGTVPEPSSILMAGIFSVGLIGLVVRKRRAIPTAC